MRGPGQPEPRRDVPLAVVRELLQAADLDVAAARAASKSSRGEARLHQAEQVRLLLLLLRLAADTGARRGELDALRLDDLHGRVLHLDRGVSDEQVTTTKTGRRRRVTVGTSTEGLWTASVTGWRQRQRGGPFGPWLFSARVDHTTRLRTDRLSQWFRTFVHDHGHAGVCLHALRHTVATVLVADGHLLQAQQRLGHAEASTTLRQYCHALPLHDLETADLLEALLAQRR